jgi:hypothetical protein
MKNRANHGMKVRANHEMKVRANHEMKVRANHGMKVRANHGIITYCILCLNNSELDIIHPSRGRYSPHSGQISRTSNFKPTTMTNNNDQQQ